MDANFTYTVSTSIGKLMEVFVNLPDFCERHPLIVSSKFLNKDLKGREIHQIIEMPIHYLPLRIKYQAIVSCLGDKVEYDIRKIPFMHPILTYNFRSLGSEKTEIIFRIRIIPVLL